MPDLRYLVATAEDTLQSGVKSQISMVAPRSELFFVPSAFRIHTMIALSQPHLVVIDLGLPELAPHLEQIISVAREADCRVTFFSTQAGDEHKSLAQCYDVSLCTGLSEVDLVGRMIEYAHNTAVQTPPVVNPARTIVAGRARPTVPIDSNEPTETLPSPGISCTGAPLPSIDHLLISMIDLGGSDLHLSVGSAPRVRVLGELAEIPGYDVFQEGEIDLIIGQIINQRHMGNFKECDELDLSYSIPGISRFRVNVFRQRNSTGAVLRTIPFEIPTFETLGLPNICRELADRPRGMVLVTGPTGSGKSTTLAAMVNYINETKAVHIMTLEDPIEFVHANKKALINQREVGEDTESFSSALKRVLRQDPDVILVGELRDLETISAAITAAETGHLVFGTLHTIGGPETIDRIIDVFPAEQQNQVRMQLSGSLIGVLTQILCPTADEKGRVMAQEIMVGVPAIKNLIREGKTHQMSNIIQGGGSAGMMTLDQSLRKLVNTNQITAETAVDKSQDAKTMAEQLGVAY